MAFKWGKSNHPPIITRQLIHGDLFDVLPTLPPNSLDACVCDPPYGLEFMGKEWDDLSHIDARQPGDPTLHKSGAGPFDRATVRHSSSPSYGGTAGKSMQQWHERWAEEVYRVLKPGGHIVAFGGSRTYHRLTCALEDAGFEIRDCLSWLYGSGFPKSLDMSKSMADPEAAEHWQGWGTGLKPAWEPIVLARRPWLRNQDDTVIENVLKHGTGGINIDACRIATDENLNGGAYAENGTDRPTYEYWRFKRLGDAGRYIQPEGRWPANVILDEEAAQQLDAQSGKFAGHGEGDFGGASRFFYCAKAPRSERDAGCDVLEALTGGQATDRQDGTDGLNSPRAGAGRTGGSKNGHPTVKPLNLMRWLVKLITPPSGVVLDPFLGSGTTAIACIHEGFGYIGIEREESYLKIAQQRILHARSPHLPPNSP